MYLFDLFVAFISGAVVGGTAMYVVHCRKKESKDNVRENNMKIELDRIKSIVRDLLIKRNKRVAPPS